MSWYGLFDLHRRPEKKRTGKNNMSIPSAIQVLQKGIPWKDQTKQYKCTGVGFLGQGCHAILLIPNSAIQEGWTSDYSGDREHYKYFTCPDCLYKTQIF